MEERITQRDVLMVLLKNVNGKYHSDFRFVKGFLLKFSSSGLYYNDQTIIKTITDAAKQVDTSILSAKSMNDQLFKEFRIYEPFFAALKRRTATSYNDVCDSVSDLCNTFYEIREHGGYFGNKFVTKQIMTNFPITIQKANELQEMSLNLDNNFSVINTIKESNKCIDEIMDLTKKPVEEIKQNYERMNQEFSEFVQSFWNNLITNKNMHQL
jgi:hypothetical protein